MQTAFLKGINPISSHQNILISSAVNVQDSLPLHSLRIPHYSGCVSEEHSYSTCFIYCFERGSIFQDNLFYFGMKVSIFINFV